jgi:cytoskeleton protein RodZ
MARGSFGERLKRERELREVTLEEITSATRIGPRFLEALENEEWEKLPGGVFNRGFVRSVARYLGLDEEVLLGEYDLAHGSQLQSVGERQESKAIPAVPRWFPLVILLGILVVLAGLIAGGIYAWRRYSANRATKQSIAMPQQAAPAKVSSEVAAAFSRAMLLELNLPTTSARGHVPPSVQ